MFHFENQDEYISWSVAHIVVSCRVAKAHYGFKYHLTFQNAVFFLIALFIPAVELSSYCFIPSRHIPVSYLLLVMDLCCGMIIPGSLQYF